VSPAIHRPEFRAGFHRDNLPPIHWVRPQFSVALRPGLSRGENLNVSSGPKLSLIGLAAKVDSEPILFSNGSRSGCSFLSG